MQRRRRFAEGTKVPAEQTRLEIEQVLARYGADQFSFGTDSTRGEAQIMFRAEGRICRFTLKVPTDGRAIDSEKRRRWRSLLLSIKAKLDSVESEIETFTEAFMAHIVVPGDKTLGEIMPAQITQAYKTGKMPESLLALPAPEGK